MSGLAQPETTPLRCRIGAAAAVTAAALLRTIFVTLSILGFLSRLGFDRTRDDLVVSTPEWSVEGSETRGTAGLSGVVGSMLWALVKGFSPWWKRRRHGAGFSGMSLLLQSCVGQSVFFRKA